jgi:TonB family protein
MRFRLSTLILLLFPALAIAQSTPPAPPASQSPQQQRLPEIVYMPPTEPMAQTLKRVRLRGAEAVLEVTIDERGLPAAVRVRRGTGKQDLDNSIVAWAKRIRFTPGAAVTGVLPVVVGEPPDRRPPTERDAAESEPPPEPREIDLAGVRRRPSLMPLKRELIFAGAADAMIACMLGHDGTGDVKIAIPEETSPSRVFDEAIALWCRRLEVQPSESHAPVSQNILLLRFRMRAGAGADTPGLVHLPLLRPRGVSTVLSQYALRRFWLEVETGLAAAAVTTSTGLSPDDHEEDIVVRVRLEISPAGSVSTAAVLRGTGREEVDRAALAHLRGRILVDPNQASGTLVLDLYRHGEVVVVEGE